MRLMKPAREGLAIPMPDRGNRLFSADGETVDEFQNYYANLIASGDLISVPPLSGKPLAGPLVAQNDAHLGADPHSKSTKG